MNYKRRKNNWIILFLILIFFVVLSTGCKPKSSKSSKEGTKGLVLNFIPNSPPDKFIVQGDGQKDFIVTIGVRNIGKYPELKEDLKGKIWISGFDKNILQFNDLSKEIPKSLSGKSDFNPEGSFDNVEFPGRIDASQIKIDKYAPVIMATACYEYKTLVSPNVCIDFNPFVPEKKVCNIKTINLGSQGAPIAITKIEEEVLGESILFRIYLKNVGGGEVIYDDGLKLDICNPDGDKKVERNNLDKISLSDEEILVGNAPCKILAAQDKNIIILADGQGSISCTVEKSSLDNTNSAFSTQLYIPLSYVYRTTISKQIQITKIQSALS